ncbi:ABC transporter permease [Marinobacterium lutimaris]|uniref:Ribose transport system permease protein n=1 Tax=Marinobacterium lutimaris TaxID=568106 RepID=A0A1H5V172_9GAMM|nr:ABC transporter permease [Marinobacterium lutimaris]SEF80418.1 ribose transport system permease protein [Marinobacterium lutimaris]
MNMNSAIKLDGSASASVDHQASKSVGFRLQVNEFAWVWIGTAVLFAISAIVAPGTVTKGALLAMLPFAGILAIVATGMTVVIQQRGLDMSVPGMVSLAGIVVAEVGFATGSFLIAIVATLAMAVVVGIINGLLTARVNITPLIATLAVNALLIGGVRAITGNSPVAVPESIQAFAKQNLLGMPSSLWLAVLFVVIVALITKRSIIGRRFVAVGVNPRTATAAGIMTLRYQVGAYVLSAICFALGGILLAGYIGNASHTAGNDYLLPAIAAVVIGGTPFTGGKGSVVASGVAALFMAQLAQLVLALGAGPAMQLLVQSLAILLAVTIRVLPSLMSGK